MHLKINRFDSIYRLLAIMLCLALTLPASPVTAASPSAPRARGDGGNGSMGELTIAPQIAISAFDRRSVTHTASPPTWNLDAVLERARLASLASLPVPVTAQPAPLSAGSLALGDGDATEAGYPPGVPGGPQAGSEDWTLAELSPTESDEPGLAAAASSTLAPGWHLLSAPEVQADTDPAAVLASIAGSYRRVYAYDACDAADPWKRYDPNDPAASDLTAIDHTMGLWVEVTETANFQTSGVLAPYTEIPLCQGWNLIGFPMDRALPIGGALQSIAGNYLRLFAWEQSDTLDPWAVHDVAAPDWANDATLMTPTRGYWLYVTEDVTLTVRVPGAPPVVRLLAPAEGSELFTHTTVSGMIDSDTVATWVMEYRIDGQSEWTAFATGDTSGSTVAEAIFDPTLAPNDLYELRLTATDANGQPGSAAVDVMVAGAQKIGHFSISFVDLAVPVAGLPISLIRTYDSRDRRRGDFGMGWTLDIRSGSYRNNRKPGDGWVLRNSGPFTLPCTEVVETKFHATEIRFSNTEFYRFRPEVTPLGAVSGGCDALITYEQVGGLPGATLESLDGDDQVHWRSGSDQLVLVDDEGGLTPYEPQRVLLTLRDGRQFSFHLTNGLESIEDPNGNRLVLSQNGITHSSGSSVAFVRDSEQRITRITDPLGNAIHYRYDANGDLVAHTDPDANTTEFIYYPGHYLKEIIDPRGVVANRIEYDADGRMIALIDGEGNRTELTHNIAGREEVIRNPNGRVTRAFYNERGQILHHETTVTIDGAVAPVVTTYEYDGDLEVAMTDPDGVRRTIAYDAGELPTQLVVDPDGLNLVTGFNYDAAGRLQVETDSAGNTISYGYNGVGELTSVVDPLGNSFALAYNSQGRVTRRTDPLGNVAAMVYNANGYPTRLEHFDGQNNLLRKEEFTYDANGRRLSATLYRTMDGGITPLTTQFGYNNLGQVVAITDTLGNVTRMEYDGVGLLTARIDALGRRTTFTYDNVGRPTRTDYPDGAFTTVRYDAAGNIDRTTDRAGRITRYEHDELGRVVKTIRPDGSTLQTVYSPGGRVMAEIDALGNRIDYEYDSAGRVVKKIYPEIFDVAQGRTVRPTFSHEYDEAGNLAAVMDALGNRTRFVYDAARQLVETRFPDGATQKRRYDARGLLVEVEDAEGRVTRYAYDALERLTRITLPAPAPGQPNPVTVYAYDEAGNKLAQVDALGRITRFRYDELNRLVERTLPLGQQAIYAYDAVGNVTSYRDFNGATLSFVYDTLNRLTRKNLPGGASVHYSYTTSGQRDTVTDSRGVTSYTYNDLGLTTSVAHPTGENVHYTYDANGNLTSMAAPGGMVQYAYNALNAIVEVSDPDGVTRYGYDANGNQRQITTADGIVTQLTFDARQRLTGIEHRNSAGLTLASFTYGLSPVGRRQRVTEADGAVVEYTYDALNRLTGEMRTGSVPYAHHYEYDAVGNRTRMVRDGVETLYAYDANDRLLSAGSLAFAYDNNGNTIQMTTGAATYDYTYDAENRLTRVAGGGDVITLGYDAEGNLIGQRSGADDVAYLVDSLNPTGYAQVIEERDGDGALLAGYSYGHYLLAMNRDGATSRYHVDGQRSTRLLTESGSVSDSYTYDAFGNRVGASGATANPYGYTSERFVEELGFYHLRARYYNPAVGRFVSADPFAGFADDPLSLHKYLYAHATPVNASDPTGHFSLIEFSVGQAVQGLLKSVSTLRKVEKVCRFKSFAENIGFAMMAKEAAKHLSYMVNFSFDLDEFNNNHSWKGQQISPALEIEIKHPLANFPATRALLGERAIQGISLKHYYKTIGDQYYLLEPWLEIKATRLNSQSLTSAFSVASVDRMAETIELVGEGKLMELKMQACGIDYLTFSANFETKYNQWSGDRSAAVMLKWNIGDMLEFKAPIVKLTPSGFE